MWFLFISHEEFYVEHFYVLFYKSSIKMINQIAAVVDNFLIHL